MPRSNPLNLDEPVISPTEFVKPLDGCPGIAVTTFSKDVIDAYVREHGLEQVAGLSSTSGTLPVYRGEAGGHPFLLYQSPCGAPSAVAAMEEVSALGCDAFVIFGSCGVIDAGSVGNAEVIVPCAAYSDEGTSLHYGRDASCPVVPVRAESFVRVAEAAEGLGIPHVTARVWTTDAFYRETRGMVDARLAAGCVAVEMEMSAIAQATRALGLVLYPFLYGADDLSGAEYDPNDLGVHGMGGWQTYMSLAEAVVRSHAEVPDGELMVPAALRK